MKLVDKAVAEDRGVIVMVPEIALTPQMISLFKSRWGSGVAVFTAHCRWGKGLTSGKE